MATGEDFRYPTTEGGQPDLPTRLMHRYLDRVMERAIVDPVVSQTFGLVLNLTNPPSTLFDPRILARVLLNRRPAPAAPPTATPFPARTLARERPHSAAVSNGDGATRPPPAPVLEGEAAGAGGVR